MKCDIISVIAFAAVAAAFPPGPAHPSGGKGITIEEAKANCPSGEVACCQNTEVLKADGVLGNLLGKGLLNNLIGTGDSSCAKTSLIENLNILGFTEKGKEGVQCSSTTACCSGDKCVAI
ncbi:hypothetical protein PISL3812_00318 [Talaromyces islandicus]|uniref:Hydrophobin n=1 Tax=Talaromyces islandicus TaxID=28573 RepID=A0A0U1LLJ4_TALIS|nr:hypothetical protein PISL3812_00318 [Talaromyces islandicus]